MSWTGSVLLLRRPMLLNIRKEKNEDAEVLDSGAGVELVSGDLVFQDTLPTVQLEGTGHND